MTKVEEMVEEEELSGGGMGVEMESLGVQIERDEKAKVVGGGRLRPLENLRVTANHKENSTTIVAPFTEETASEAGTGVVLALKMILTRPQPAPGHKERPVYVKDLTATTPKLLPLMKDSKDKKPHNMVSVVVTGVVGGKETGSKAKSGSWFEKLKGKKKEETWPLAVMPGGTVEVGLQVWMLLGCNVNVPLELELEVGEGGGAFTIGHLLSLESESELSKELGPVAPFQPPQRRRPLRFERKAVKGALLPGGRGERNQLDKKVNLPMYPVPMAVRVLLAHRMSVPADKGHSEELLTQMRDMLALMDEELNEENYVNKFSLFLHLNELEQQGFLESYTMESGVYLKAKPEPIGVGIETKKVYELNVPGLAEGRPKIVVGDPIYLTVLRNKRRYEGLVRALVSPHTISIGMSKQFEAETEVESEAFKVEFGMCRVPVRMQQRALTAATDIMASLFPRNLPSLRKAPLPNLDFLNPKVAKNPEQRTAVQNIVAGHHHPAPYIIFGPPGTGKTVTLVEGIAQMVRARPEARILACATSNAAVDLLANRLLHYLPPDEMMRLNACSRSLYSMDQETQVFEISPVSENKEHFIIPPADVLASKRVILSTLCNAGQMATAGLGTAWVDVVFVDEAGQGCEPETLVALGGVAGPNTRIVLAGDPHQLGPVLYSRHAAAKGLATPLMERLMRDFSCYAKEGAAPLDRSLDAAHLDAYNPRLITKLVRNYRSHPSLLQVPSSLFYADELVAAAELGKESLSTWSGLPVQGVPLIVHGVVGAEMREARSPSFFNPLEMCVVKSYVDQLLGATEHGVKDKHIGIIAPYHQQVRKTKTMLSRELEKYGNMCVGSVEEFQGAERRILILSTVRSSPDCLAELEAEEAAEGGRPKGRLGGIGFLANPKRFNTAITRAKALLIVVGNPYVLQKDHYWRSILEFALEKGAYRGVGFKLSAPSTSTSSPVAAAGATSPSSPSSSSNNQDSPPKA